MRFSQVAIVLVVLAGLLPVALRAQYPKAVPEASSALHGTVVNAKGTAVVGAHIFWQAADGGKPHVTRSDAEGHFHIRPLRPGLYEVRASFHGAWSDWAHNVVVRPGQEANIQLQLAVPTMPAKASSR